MFDIILLKGSVDMIKNKNEIILFEDEKVKLEVNVQDETVWLNRQEMAELFDRDIKTIGKHINNALKEELSDIAVVAKFATTAADGKTYNVEYYSLDMIISVGYRVKSSKGIKFRIWANKILKDYMLKGYAINKKRLEYLEKTIKLIDIATRLDEELRSDESYNMIKIISEYTKALETLEKYDKKTIEKLKGNIDFSKRIKYEDCLEIINKMSFKKSSDIFGVERDRRIRINYKQYISRI